MRIQTYTQQPSERIRYEFSADKWLATGETLVQVETQVDGGLQIDSVAIEPLTARRYSFMVSGGTDGQEYEVTARCTTSIGQIREFEMTVQVEDI